MVNNMKRIIDDVNRVWERRYRFSFILTIIVYCGTFGGVGWVGMNVYQDLSADNRELSTGLHRMRQVIDIKGNDMVGLIKSELHKAAVAREPVVDPILVDPVPEPAKVIEYPQHPQWRVVPCGYPVCPWVYQ